MRRKICLLTDQDLDATPFPEGDWPCDPRPFLPDADWSVMTLKKESCVGQVVRAAEHGYEVFFNLCDGAWDEGRVGIEVIQALESVDAAFTGADSRSFEPSREAMKRVCRAWDIGTPGYLIARGPREVEAAADMLSFPMIVKHPRSYASCGITPASRVTNVDDLSEQVRIMVAQYGSALIEEFIEGTEYTVLVAENVDDPGSPFVYHPIQYRFPEGESFKHYDLKWVDFHGLASFPVEDPEVADALRAASGDFFLGTGGVGYGRCDVRMDAAGRLFMLEINPNCGIYYPPTDPASADLILLNDPDGHAGFTRRIVDAAIGRQRRRARPWQVRPRPTGDHGTFATRDLTPGETIVRWEGTPHTLVSRTHVEANWDARHRDWFARYAWPLTDEIWVTWNEDPEEWRPVNHGCDPNAWLSGLDVVARRPIAAGEEIVLDYATFYDERMPAFECRCGVPDCRKVVRGDDYTLDIVARYEGHLSDHVARRRAHRRA